MRFLTPSIFLTLTSTLTVSALPAFSQFETRTDDLISRDGLAERAVDTKAQAMADKIEKDIMMEEWGHNKRAVDAKSQAMADKIEKAIMMEEWGHNKRAVANDAKAQAMADKIEKDIMMEEWGHNKRSPKTKKLSAAELAQADAEEEEDEEENTKRALFGSKTPATGADATAGGNSALATSITAAIAEDEAPGLAERSPKVKKLSAAELAQADAEEEEDEEDN